MYVLRGTFAVIRRRSKIIIIFRFTGGAAVKNLEIIIVIASQKVNYRSGNGDNH